MPAITPDIPRMAFRIRNTMKQYDALICRADRPALDFIIAISGTLPITGVVDNDTSITMYFDEGIYEESMPEDILRWLPEETDVEFERGSVEEQNWNAEFERSLQPVRLTDRLVITQSWNPVQPSGDDDLVITIDPKMSFGTGHHESTRLIATLMTAVDISGRRVLDIGTGTGVLAIMAAGYGAGHILAIDNNEWAVENTHENIALNGVEGIDVRLCELADVEEGGFDIILANIHRNVIIELLPDMMRKLRRSADACILTSGVLIADYESLVDAAAGHGLQPAAEATENEWIATRFILKPDDPAGP